MSNPCRDTVIFFAAFTLSRIAVLFQYKASSSGFSELTIVTSYAHGSVSFKNFDRMRITSLSVSVLKYLGKSIFLAEGSGSSASFCHVPCMMQSNIAAIVSSDHLNQGPVNKHRKLS